MKYTVLIIFLLVSFVILSESGFCQEPPAEHKVKGLKGLLNVAVVIRQNPEKVIVRLKELSDMLDLALHRNVPELTVLENVKTAQAWLEFNYITAEDGFFLELSVYRWVRILDSGEEIFTKVWWDGRAGFGRVSRSNLQEALDYLFISFAADYVRAKR